MHHIDNEEDLLKNFNMSEEAHGDHKMKVESEPKPHPLALALVSFAETSKLHVYRNKRDDLYRSNIAYSPDDREFFTAEAQQEADRIKDLIVTAPQDSRADSIKYLLKNNIVTTEEFVGIEHLVLDKPSSRSKIRKHHSTAVLKKHQEQQQQQQQASLQDPTIVLGKFSRKNSLESRNRARNRAALCREPQSSLKMLQDAECVSLDLDVLRPSV
jgi:hypothetical protein